MSTNSAHARRSPVSLIRANKLGRVITDSAMRTLSPSILPHHENLSRIGGTGYWKGVGERRGEGWWGGGVAPPHHLTTSLPHHPSLFQQPHLSDLAAAAGPTGTRLGRPAQGQRPARGCRGRDVELQLLVRLRQVAVHFPLVIGHEIHFASPFRAVDDAHPVAGL